MPSLFRERGNFSMIDLLAEVGGPAAIAGIRVADLAAALRDRPECVRAWVGYSEDNRSSPAWFIQASPNGSKWVVGFYPDGESVQYDTASDACSHYIRHYLDQLCMNIVR